jgi:hypothetical protein
MRLRDGPHSNVRGCSTRDTSNAWFMGLGLTKARRWEFAISKSDTTGREMSSCRWNRLRRTTPSGWLNDLMDRRRNTLG